MKYRYQAKTKEGEMQVGFVEAGSRDAAANILAGHDLYILKIEDAEKVRWYDRVEKLWSGVKRRDMVIFTRQLSTLLESRLSLNKALTTLYEQTANPELREAVFQISQDIDSGLAFSQALERQSNLFSQFFVSMVRAAEVTGNLDQVAGFLADYTEQEMVLVSKARSALIYPCILVGLFLVVGVIMVTVVFPQIQPVFDQAGVQLPLFSRILIATGVFIRAYWFALILLFAVLAIMGVDYFQTAEGKALWDELKTSLPIIKRIYLPLTITRFANAATTLIRGGIPVAQAVEIVGETVDNVLYREVLHEVAEEVRQGVSLSAAIAKHPNFFPVLVPQMLAVGEATGRLDEIFGRIAKFFSRESDAVVNNLVDLIQPVLLIGVGLLVGLLFASVLLPLYQLTGTIR